MDHTARASPILRDMFSITRCLEACGCRLTVMVIALLASAFALCMQVSNPWPSRSAVISTQYIQCCQFALAFNSPGLLRVSPGFALRHFLCMRSLLSIPDEGIVDMSGVQDEDVYLLDMFRLPSKKGRTYSTPLALDMYVLPFLMVPMYIIRSRLSATLFNQFADSQPSAYIYQASIPDHQMDQCRHPSHFVFIYVYLLWFLNILGDRQYHPWTGSPVPFQAFSLSRTGPGPCFLIWR